MLGKKFNNTSFAYPVPTTSTWLASVDLFIGTAYKTN